MREVCRTMGARSRTGYAGDEMASPEIIAEIERLLPGMSDGELARLLATVLRSIPESTEANEVNGPRRAWLAVRGVPESQMARIAGIVSLGGDAVEDSDRID